MTSLSFSYFVFRFSLAPNLKTKSRRKPMPSLTAKDRAPLCLFSYEDGRRCRTPRIASHPHFCFYHAQKESQAQSAEKLAKDLDYFFSGDYLSACDLSTAMGRLIPAVIRGHIKTRLARTVAYMLQTQLQAIHLAQHEYINAFGTDGWRDAVRHSVNANNEHLSPPDPVAAEPDAQPFTPSRVQPLAQAAPPSPAPRASVGAGLARPDAASLPTANARPTPTQAEAALAIARNIFPERPNTEPTQSEPPAAATAPPTNTATPTQTAQPSDPTPTPSEPPTQRRQPGAPTRDPYAVHFDHNYRLIVNGNPW
jgi:hypothetical protein